MPTPISQLRARALSQYTQAVEDILARAQVQTGDPDLSFMDLNDPAGSVVRFCQAGGIGSYPQLNLISGLMSLTWWCGLSLSEGDHAAIMATARRALRDLVGRPSGLGLERLSGPRHHLIFTGQLQSPHHSPSRGAIDYARAIAEGDPGASITFLLAPFQIHPDTAAHARQAFSALDVSPDFRDFNQDGAIRDILDRSDHLISHIWCANALDPRISELALITPTIMFTCGDVPPFQYADVYWHQQSDDYVRALWSRYGVPPAFIANYSGGAPCTHDGADDTFDRATKSDFGFSDDQVILVTVGNRLGVDMGPDFIAGMLDLTLGDSRLVWLIVGPLDPALLATLQQAAGGQIMHIPFTTELLTLLSMTDIFANPFRKGGGESALSAMRAGTVVMTRTDFGDVAALVPPASDVPDAEAFFGELRALTRSSALREARLRDQSARLAEILDQSVLSRVIQAHVSTATDRFARRQIFRTDILPES